MSVFAELRMVEMRTIKFRGKVDGYWVYGNLSILEIAHGTIKPGYYISNIHGSPFAYKVDPETVGQFTDHQDENGNDIYEKDIWHGTGVHGIGVMNRYYSVGWDVKNACFKFMSSLVDKARYTHIPSLKHSEKGKIIGNLIDAPESIAEQFKSFNK